MIVCIVCKEKIRDELDRQWHQAAHWPGADKTRGPDTTQPPLEKSTRTLDAEKQYYLARPTQETRSPEHPQRLWQRILREQRRRLHKLGFYDERAIRALARYHYFKEVEGKNLAKWMTWQPPEPYG